MSRTKQTLAIEDLAPAPKKPSPKPAVDWLAMRNAFVYGAFDAHGTRVFPDLKQVAAAHGLSYATVRAVARRGNRSVAGSWSEDRLRAQQRLAETLDAKRTTATANAIVEAEARHLKLWTATEASASRKLFDVRDGGVLGFKQELSVAETRGLIEVLRIAVAGERMGLGMAETRVAINDAASIEADPMLLPPEIRDLPAALQKAFLRKLGDNLAILQTTLLPPPKAHNRMLANDMHADEGDDGDGEA